MMIVLFVVNKERFIYFINFLIYNFIFNFLGKIISGDSGHI